MKTLIFIVISFFSFKISNAQQKIKVDPIMLIQLRIPIQPNHKAWVNWNIMQSLQDSTKTIRIDRKVQGYAPFIARHDAPYYSASQKKEIQMGLEKILNPDGYFSGQQEFMDFYQDFLSKFVFEQITEKK